MMTMTEPRTYRATLATKLPDATEWDIEIIRFDNLGAAMAHVAERQGQCPEDHAKGAQRHIMVDSCEVGGCRYTIHFDSRHAATRPTVKQAVNRMLSGHITILRLARDGGKLHDASMATAGMIRGWVKARSTLARWGAIEGDTITDFGRELLAEVETKWGRS